MVRNFPLQLDKKEVMKCHSWLQIHTFQKQLYLKENTGKFWIAVMINTDTILFLLEENQ